MLSGIIFDLDGVLIDSEPLMRLAFNESYHRVIGEGSPPIEEYLHHMGESFPNIMDRLGLPRSLWQPFREICEANVGRIKIFPEATALLEAAHSLNLKLAIVTGKDRVRTLQILNHFRLHHFFDAVVASDQVKHSKPHPEGILNALELMECGVEEVVMVGDGVNDILCAQAAGVTTIAVTWGIKPERVQTLCRPDCIVHDWKSLLQRIIQLKEQGAKI